MDLTPLSTKAISQDIVSTIKDIKEKVFVLKNDSLDAQERSKIRDILINKVKYLVVHQDLGETQKKFTQLILTKLFAWSPFHSKLSDVGNLPSVVEDLFNSAEGIAPGQRIPAQQESILPILSIKYYKNDGKEIIEDSSPIAISLIDALKQIQSFPSLEQFKGSLIGFINPKGETINLIRRDDKFWMLDIPFSEEDEYSQSLNDSSLTNEGVKELISMFFNEADGMNQIRRKLMITEQIKAILILELKLKRTVTTSEITEKLQYNETDSKKLVDLLNATIPYEPYEIELLKLKAAETFSKLLDPNLYEMIANLGYDFYTAKKVGKYLLDSGWIKDLLRIPLKK